MLLGSKEKQAGPMFTEHSSAGQLGSYEKFLFSVCETAHQAAEDASALSGSPHRTALHLCHICASAAPTHLFQVSLGWILHDYRLKASLCPTETVVSRFTRSSVTQQQTLFSTLTAAQHEPDAVPRSSHHLFRSSLAVHTLPPLFSGFYTAHSHE